MRHSFRHQLLKLLAVVFAGFTLCNAVGCSSMAVGPMSSVQPVTADPHVGSVYLLRGWIGVFSTGIDHLGERLNEQGVHAQVFQETQWPALADEIVAKYKGQANHEPIVLIGHSYGADSVIRIARKVQDAGVKVDLVVTLDPVTPPKVPNNVGLVYNLYQSNGVMDNLPWLRGIPLTADDNAKKVTLRNMNIRTQRTDLLESGLDHFNIEKKEKIQVDVVAQVMKVCEPRPMWAAAHASAAHAQLASANLAAMPAVTKLSAPMVTPPAPVSPPAQASGSKPPAQIRLVPGLKISALLPYLPRAAERMTSLLSAPLAIVRTRQIPNLHAGSAQAGLLIDELP